MSEIIVRTFADYGPAFEFYACCQNMPACGHEAKLTNRPPNEVVDDLQARLKCSKCGSKDVQIQRVYRGSDDPLPSYGVS